ncbi:e3 ubiquitin ligase ARI7 [Fusarium pseudoanthophilum]|uniref:E3 ubiquitin ligase ARI7 n=1 Tax=Fusarium pseudoanthophilum TaxID=48495 RepID=A0A8H5PCM7_9HYPO|nr:e3 ubiquitin ligase ARI7 [Fusarium pseudoanthophilum]
MGHQHPPEEQPIQFLKIPEKSPLRMRSTSRNQPVAKSPEFDNQAFDERSERDLAAIFCSQEKQIESLQETVSNLLGQNKLLISRYYDRMNESVSLRSKALASNHELQNALSDTKAMAYAVHELQGQILQLKQPKISSTTPRSIIVNKLLNPMLSAANDSHPFMPIPIQMAKDLKGTLDRAMSADEALYIYTIFENWLGTEALQSVVLVTCCVCQKVRFRQTAGFSKPRPLNEFIERDLRLGCEKPLMQTLYFVEPRLTSEARHVAARLHFKMMRNGLMHSPFDQRYRRSTRSEAGSPSIADFSHVELYSIDDGRKTLQVPIFTQLLRLEKTPIDCVLCAESIYNISYDAVDEWIEVCTEFDGDWVWKISRFPKILRARCIHKIDFCTSCLQKHIGYQVEQLDKSACDDIRCPSLTCQRLLTYEEVQLYAQKEAFAK